MSEEWHERQCCDSDCRKKFFCQGNCKEHMSQHDYCCCPKCIQTLIRNNGLGTIAFNPALCPRVFEVKEKVIFT